MTPGYSFATMQHGLWQADWARFQPYYDCPGPSMNDKYDFHLIKNRVSTKVVNSTSQLSGTTIENLVANLKRRSNASARVSGCI